MEPGLVAFYDIQSGNGAGLFLQPQSPHGAMGLAKETKKIGTWNLAPFDGGMADPVETCPPHMYYHAVV